MSKKAGSIAVICILTILLIISVAIFFLTQNSFDNMQNVDPSNDQLPGASVLATIIGSLTVWLGFILGEFIVSMSGSPENKLLTKLVFLCLRLTNRLQM